MYPIFTTKEEPVCIIWRKAYDQTCRGGTPVYSLLWNGFLEESAVYGKGSSAAGADADRRILKGEITFARTTLPEALERIGGKTEPPFSDFLETLAVRMKKYSGEKFSYILQQTMNDTMKNTYLEEEDMESFYQAACNLGYLDREMQIHLLESYLKEQGQKVEMLTAQLPGKRKLSRSLGILGGAFLVILLL